MQVELKGAKLMEAGPPCFIWTFNTQQVNCLRDVEGDIIEGAVDDIRTVHYAMVVTRHPELGKSRARVSLANFRVGHRGQPAVLVDMYLTAHAGWRLVVANIWHALPRIHHKGTCE